MGFLRLFLAVSVILTHTTPLFGLQWMPGTTAVQAFFIISGFYMSLVLSGKYGGANQLWTFYSNRLLRLFPAYFVAVAMTAAVESLVYAYRGDPAARAITVEIARRLAGESGGLDTASLIAVLIPNVALFGSDLLFLFHRVPEWGWLFTPGMDPQVPNATRMGNYLLIAPAWSVGIELWFYLLIPFMVRWRIAALALVAALSLGLQWAMYVHAPWSSYFLFPANLGLFLLGTIGHKLWTSTGAGVRIPPRAIHALAWGGLAMLVLREFIPFFRNYPVLICTVAALSIPFIFEISKRSRVDRWLGNLSYPVYLFHMAVATAFESFLHTKSGWAVVLATLAVASVVNVLIEEPLEKLRARRWRQSLAGRASGIPIRDPVARPESAS